MSRLSRFFYLLLGLWASSASFALAEEPGVCPGVQLIPDASAVTRFAGAGIGESDIDYSVAIERLDYECAFIPAGIEMTLKVSFIVKRGPANQDATADFSYFVIVAKADGSPLVRSDFAIAVPFTGGKTVVRATEVLAPLIPLAEGDSGANYRLYLALKMTQEELDRVIGR